MKNRVLKPENVGAVLYFDPDTITHRTSPYSNHGKITTRGTFLYFPRNINPNAYGKISFGLEESASRIWSYAYEVEHPICEGIISSNCPIQIIKSQRNIFKKGEPIYEERCVEKEVKAKGLTGLLGKKQKISEKQRTLVGNAQGEPYTSKEIIKNSRDESPAYLLQWAIPGFTGFGADKRTPQTFILHLIIDEETNSTLETKGVSLQEFHELGKELYPEIFDDLAKGIPYEDYTRVPVYIIDQNEKIMLLS